MMHHSISDVRILARAYLEATGISGRALSLEISRFANNSKHSGKMIQRILAGKSCIAEGLESASQYLTANWPEGLPWPLEQRQADIEKLRNAAE